MARVYSKEFREQLVELHARGKTCQELGKEFDVSPTSVANWVRAKKRRGRVDEPGEPGESQHAQIERLKRELIRKDEELEVLGKALAFFARRLDE